MPETHDESKRHARTAKRILAIGLPLVVIAATGIGYAAWTQTGAGVGNAVAKSAVDSTVTGVAGTADLYPGKTGGSVSFTVNNPNPYPVKFTTVTPGAVTSLSPGTCASNNVTVSATPVTIPGGLALAAGATSATQTITGVTNMISDADNGCQAVGFTVALSVTGASNAP